MHWMNSTMRQKHLCEVFSWLKAVFPTFCILGFFFCMNIFWLYQRSGLNGHTSSEYNHFILWSMQKNLRFQKFLDLSMVWIALAESLEFWYSKCLLQWMEVQVLHKRSSCLGTWWLCHMSISMPQVAGNDSRIAQDLYSRLLNLPRDYQWIADSAFPKIGAVGARLLSSLQDDVLQELSWERYGEAVLLNAKICSLRQAPEWGNGNLESIFARLLLPLTEREDGLLNYAFECSISELVHADSLT
jgi:hypothetical protein